MDTADRVMVALGDPGARGALLDSAALLGVARTCYEVEPAWVVGGVTAVFERFDLAVPVDGPVTVLARWAQAVDPVPGEASATLTGLAAPVAGADAVWAGSVVLRLAAGEGIVEAATVTAGASRTEGDYPLDLRLAFSAPPVTGADTPPITLPVVVAFLVAEADEGPRSLLRRGAAARRAAAGYSVPPPPQASPPRLRRSCVCWLLQAATFDDDGWPGGGAGPPDQRRADRLAAARAWLGDQGIAVVTTD
ncbi:hypothetical protein [Streptomyces sp. GbtcB7]|uniref:hypothetical protein n=1 Tax=Streptomyces sp. GbtcB7 TaxID=2824752 RepID=UPI001C3076B2|nr:hypothetical protein [Streptomyces sp. GbtcB7]